MTIKYTYAILWLFLVSVTVHCEIIKIPLYRAQIPYKMLTLESKTETLKNYYNVEYYGNITIGVPSQNFRVAFDTAFADIWVPGQKCPSIACYMHSKYNSLKSVTYQEDGRNFTLNNKYQNIAGRLCNDRVCIGKTCAHKQMFGEVLKHAGLKFSFSHFDGVVGLGYQALATDGVKPLFQSLVEQKKVDKPIFSFWMDRSGYNSFGGELTLGGIDPTRYTGNIHYVPIVKQGYWQFEFEHVANDNGETIVCDGPCQGIPDTASTGIVGNRDTIEFLQQYIGAKIDESGRYTVDCDKIDELPTIHFSIGKKMFHLTPHDYIMKFYFQSLHRCQSALFGTTYPRNNNEDLWVFGTNFLSKYYTVFDLENLRLGFAEVVPVKN